MFCFTYIILLQISSSFVSSVPANGILAWSCNVGRHNTGNPLLSMLNSLFVKTPLGAFCHLVVVVVVEFLLMMDHELDRLVVDLTNCWHSFEAGWIHFAITPWLPSKVRAWDFYQYLKQLQLFSFKSFAYLFVRAVLDLVVVSGLNVYELFYASPVCSRVD